MIDDRLKFRAWIGKEKALVSFGARYIYFDAINGLSDFIKNNEGFDVIEQCTGLKDKNGKLIYENDLIKIDDDVAVIKWSDYYARFMLESSEDNFDFETTYAEECEIIGNIHENADLLEVGGK